MQVLLQQNKTQLKLNLSHTVLSSILGANHSSGPNGNVDIIVYDTRKIGTKRNAVFFALQGIKKNGLTYCEDAYRKGVRCFVVASKVTLPDDCFVIKVEDTLQALQTLAKYHRSLIQYPIIAITGSYGKTTIKEWMYFLLKDHFRVSRTPKSYNSQIGVAHSILELPIEADFGIIEADISHPEEMDSLEAMIAPQIGIFTGVGNYYTHNFENQEQHISEHLKLFDRCGTTITVEEFGSDLRRRKIQFQLAKKEKWANFLQKRLPFINNQLLLFEAVSYLGLPIEIIESKASKLPQLPGRLEIFEGINDNLVIDDTYNIDIDALDQALEYLMTSKEKTKKVLILETKGVEEFQKEKIIQLVERYEVKHLLILESEKIALIKGFDGGSSDLPSILRSIENSAILIKGPFQSSVNQCVEVLKKKSHETYLSFDLKAIKNNLNYFRELIPADTKLLVMVKAAAYGAGEIKIPHFLQENGVDYLGVAYADEGVLLRRNNIHLPILVMNTENDAFSDIIRFDLEPSLYSFDVLNAFIQFLVDHNLENFPVHIKVDTGMNRLGFKYTEVPVLIKKLKATNIIAVKSVFTHLSDADNLTSNFSELQLKEFTEIKSLFMNSFSQEIVFHALNSEGIIRYSSNYSFNMVRLGLGLFGYSQSPNASKRLEPAVAWKTTLAQIKNIKKGEFVGYGRAYAAKKDMTIGIIRVGYADGFSRRLSNGTGEVIINKRSCKVIGNVCMDMAMVDITHVSCAIGDEVEIFGQQQNIFQFANHLKTIPYEILTTIGKRVWRRYLL
ncbi:MAG: alanine racemase [Crocinitomicaceae bacterium]|nr:alanine racemase [Crocinitomicaceae bacterium]